MLFSFTQYECKTRYCAADAVECAGTDENRDCATPAPQPATLTGIQIIWEGSSSVRRGDFDRCRIGSVSKVWIERNRWSLPHNGGSTTHFTFFYLFLGKGCAQRVAHSWWRTDRRSGRHKMCVTWWAVSRTALTCGGWLVQPTHESEVKTD